MRFLCETGAKAELLCSGRHNPRFMIHSSASVLVRFSGSAHHCVHGFHAFRWKREQSRCNGPIHWIYFLAVYPDDTRKDLATVLSYMAGRTLSKEEIWKAMELPRSTYYDQLEKRTLITADNLRRAAANLGINRAELLTRYRLIDPQEVATLAEEIAGLRRPLSFPPSRTGEITRTAMTTAVKRGRFLDYGHALTPPRCSLAGDGTS